MPVIKETPNTLWLRNVRLSFPDVLVPKASTATSAPRYAATFIMAPDAPEWAEMAAMMNEMYAEKWGQHAAGISQLIAQDKKLRCYGFGQEKMDATGQIYDGFQDKVFISAARKEADGRPKLYDQQGQECAPGAPLNEWFAGGNYCDAVISFWLQNNEHGRALRCQLVGIQYVREGEKFGQVEADASSIFQAVEGAPAPTAPVPGMAPPAAPVAPPAMTPPALAPVAPPAIDPFS